MKTVWIINHYAQSPGGAGGTRHFQLAKALRDEGWNPWIIAASTEYTTGLQRLEHGVYCRLDVFDRVPFLWLRAPAYKGNGLGRIANMLVFAARLLGRAPRRQLPRPDVIIGSSVHPFAVLSAERLARRYGVPFVFEVRDLWPQTLIDFGLIKHQSLMARLLRALEGFLYRRARAIVVLLPFAHRYIERFAIATSRIHWIPNGVDLAAWPEPGPADSNGPLKLMYFGAFGQANALDVLLLAMHELQVRPAPPHVYLRLIGDGPLKPDLISMAERLCIANVSFEDPVPKCEIPLLSLQADVFCFSLVDSPVFSYGISSNKLYDYMSGARPIIFGCAAANNPVAAAAAGITVPPGNPAALADAIVEMAQLSPEERRRMGLAGRAYVEREHNSDLLGAKLADVLNGCLEEKNS